MLLLYFESKFSEPMGQRIFVNFLQMTMPVVKMDGVGRLSNGAAKLKNRFQIASSLCFYVPFCG